MVEEFLIKKEEPRRRGKALLLVAILLCSIVGIGLVVAFVPDFDILDSFDIFSDDPILSDSKYSADWVIDGDTVYYENDDYYLSVTPHTIQVEQDVIFEFMSKNTGGNYDAIWGFNTTMCRPGKNPMIWRNYTHVKEVWGNGHYNITIDNITAFWNLGIENYSNYVVDYGNENNSKLFMLELHGNTTIVIAFLNQTTLDDDSARFHGLHDTFIYPERKYEDWKLFEKDYEVINKLYRNYSKWYVLENQSVIADKLYRLKIRMKPQIGIGLSGKYWWGIRPIGEPISSGIYIDPWFHSNWAYRILIKAYADTYMSGGADLKSFPMLVQFNDNSSLYQKINDTAGHIGDDIIFIDYLDNTTQYDHEIEKITHAGSVVNATIHVNVTTVRHDTETRFWMYFCNNFTDSSFENMTDTWNDHYFFVLHENETGTTGSRYVDSTDNNWKMPLIDADGDTVSQRGVVGKIDSNTDVNGDADHGECLTAYDVSANENVTIEVWVRPDTNSGNRGLTGNEITSFVTVSGYVTARNEGAGGFATANSSYRMGTSQYYYLVDRQYAGWVDLFINADKKGNHLYLPNKLKAGRKIRQFYGSQGGGTMWDGHFDELRWSNCRWPGDWINVTFHSYNQSPGFITYGALEGEAPPSSAPYADNPFPPDTSKCNDRPPSHLSVLVNDTDTAVVNASFYSYDSGVWTLLETISNISISSNLSDGLEATWHLNENNNSKYAYPSYVALGNGSAYSYNGIDNKWWGDGKLFNCFKSGMSTISSPERSHLMVNDTAVCNFSQTTNFSFSFWYKLDALSTAINQSVMIARCEGDGDQGWYFSMTKPAFYGGYNLTFTFMDKSALPRNATRVITNVSFPAVDVWHHVVVTYNATKWTTDGASDVHIYVNGTDQPVTIRNFENQVLGNSSGRILGVDNCQVEAGLTFGSINRTYTTNHMNGSLDEVRFYNYTLFPSNVSTLYNKGAGTEGMGRVAMTLNTGWAGNCNQTYNWSINVSDGTGLWFNRTYTFKTLAPPTIGRICPTNGETNYNNATMFANVTASSDGCPDASFIVYWYTNYTGSWHLFNTSSVYYGNQSYVPATNTSWMNTSCATQRWWRMCVENDQHCWTNETYTFTTGYLDVPTVTFVYPTNNSDINWEWWINQGRLSSIVDDDCNGNIVRSKWYTDNYGTQYNNGTSPVPWSNNASVGGDPNQWTADTSYWWGLNCYEQGAPATHSLNVSYTFNLIPNFAPNASNPFPYNDSQYNAMLLHGNHSANFTVTLTDEMDDTMKVEFWAMRTDVAFPLWSSLGTHPAAGYLPNNTRVTHWLEGLICAGEYVWSVNVTDRWGAYEWFPQNGMAYMDFGGVTHDGWNFTMNCTNNLPWVDVLFPSGNMGCEEWENSNHTLVFTVFDYEGENCTVDLCFNNLFEDDYAFYFQYGGNNFSANTTFFFDMSEVIHFCDMTYNISFNVFDDYHGYCVGCGFWDFFEFDIGTPPPGEPIIISIRECNPHDGNYTQQGCIGRGFSFDVITNSSDRIKLHSFLSDWDGKLLAESSHYIKWDVGFGLHPDTLWDYIQDFSQYFLPNRHYYIYIGVDRDTYLGDIEFQTLYDDSCEILYEGFSKNFKWGGGFGAPNDWVMLENWTGGGANFIGVAVRFATYDLFTDPWGEDAGGLHGSDWYQRFDDFSEEVSVGYVEIIVALLVISIFTLFPVVASKYMKKDVPTILYGVFFGVGVIISFGMGLFPIWLVVASVIVILMISIYKVIAWVRKGGKNE